MRHNPCGMYHLNNAYGVPDTTALPIRIRRELAANLTERDRATVEQARHLARRLRAALRRRRTHSSICQHERVLLVRLQRQRDPDDLLF